MILRSLSRSLPFFSGSVLMRQQLRGHSGVLPDLSHLEIAGNLKKFVVDCRVLFP